LIREKKKRSDSKFARRFLAIVRYELLWNIRKKKFLGMIIIAFALATIALVVPVILSNVRGVPISQNPDQAVTTGVGIGGFGFFLFAVVIAMNSISGEFESGTIVPLLTKPVSRTMIFLGKMFASFLILLVTYAILLCYLSIGSIVIYGPQNNLHLLPLSLIGSIISTFIWIALILTIGTISKSSMIAALGAFGIWMGLTIASGVVSVATEQAWVLNYLPGDGASGYIGSFSLGATVSTGTNSIASNLIAYVLNPSANVTYFKISSSPNPPFYQLTPLHTEALSLILARSIIVAAIYIMFFMFISWFALRRAEVLE
jgi:ABC-type transport system involved in multi-copper enzyme maturation permease subunit